MATQELAPPASALPWRKGNGTIAWPLLAVCACMVVAHFPLLGMHFRQLWERPHYQFFPLLLAGVGALTWVRLRNAPPFVPGSPRVTYSLMALAWVVLAGGEFICSPWLGMVAFLILLVAIICAVGGGQLFRRLLTVWLLLWFIVPPPFGYDQLLIRSLQTLTARWSSALLDYFQVYHVMAGNVVEISGKRLLVEESCAGINSLISILAITGYYLFLVKRPIIRSVLLVVASVGWVLVGNVVRVVSVAYLQAKWGKDLSTGWQHDALGMGIFVLALALIWSTDRFLRFLTNPTRARVKRREPAADVAMPVRASQCSPGGAGSPVQQRKSLAAAWVFAVLFALLPAAHLALYPTNLFGFPTDHLPIPQIEGLSATTLPDKMHGWQQVHFFEHSRNAESEFGHFSKIWQYQVGPNPALISLDYPFDDWHDLAVCYKSQGWTVTKTQILVDQSDPSAAPLRYSEINLSKPGNRSGYVVFCAFDSRGDFLDPPASANPALLRHSSALSRLLAWRRGDTEKRKEPEQPVYQVQVFLESYAPLTQKEQDDVRQLLLEARIKLHQFFFTKR